MSEQKNNIPQQKSTSDDSVSPLQVNIPEGLNVTYTDSLFVHQNQYGVVIDFAQTVGTTNRQNVIARVGMSREHAEAFLKVLKKNLDDNKNEKEEKE